MILSRIYSTVYGLNQQLEKAYSKLFDNDRSVNVNSTSQDLSLDVDDKIKLLKKRKNFASAASGATILDA
jgi:hypothetical protein